jgi:hypothetical protein
MALGVNAALRVAEILVRLLDDVAERLVETVDRLLLVGTDRLDVGALADRVLQHGKSFWFSAVTRSSRFGGVGSLERSGVGRWVRARRGRNAEDEVDHRVRTDRRRIGLPFGLLEAQQRPGDPVHRGVERQAENDP